MRLACTLATFLGFSFSPALAGGLVWLETEHFRDLGGWTADGQFIDQMGSPYLMAIGLGKPVEDAVATATPPGPGRYRLWARTKDWMPEHHPGRFQIVVGGKPLDRVFGRSGRSGWHWEDGGHVELAARTEIRLRDLTGYYARCDAVVLSADLAWNPPDDKETIAALRIEHGGLSREVKQAGDYDVVVVGGGLAGCMAAVTSARLGCRTALVQDRPVLGGNASVEILVPPVGIWPHSRPDPLSPRETGLIGEVRTDGNQRAHEAKVYSARLLRLVQAEPDLDLYLNTRATGVEMRAAGEGGQPPFSPKGPDGETASNPAKKGTVPAAKKGTVPGRAVAAVLAVDARTGQRLALRAKVFIDCTGDASIGAAAGAEFRHGKEPRSMYGESLAPDEPSTQTMGNSLKYVSQPAGQPQPFETPAWAFQFRKPEDIGPGRYPRLGADIGWQWMLELGGTRDTIADAEEIRDDLLRLIFGLWGYVKNHSPTLKEKAADHKLVWVAHVAGKRESRRLIGDYVLTQNDIGGQTLFPDRVAFGGWGVDDHHSDGFFYRPWPASAMPVHMFAKGQLHSIPFRSLYSRNVENLLMAGRNVSASHVAMAATRVMLTCAVMGQAAGTGAALCVEHATTPREVGQKHLEQLQQQLLKDGAYLIGVPNRDPRDLARAATATASSQRTREGGEVMAAANVLNGIARAEDGRTNAWSPKKGDGANLPRSGPEGASHKLAPSPFSASPWIELAWLEPKTFNTVHVTFQTKNHAPERFAVHALAGGEWKTLAEVSACRRQRYVLGLDKTTAARLRVVLLEAARPEVGICEVRVYDEPPRVVECARRALANMQKPDGPLGLPWDDSADEVTGIDPKKLPGIVLDDAQAEAAGDWIESTWSGRYVGRGYQHDGNADKGQKSLRFSPEVPKAGRYEIRLAYVPCENRATNTPVTVQTARGRKTVWINQREAPPIDGLFRSLGAFELEAGRSVTITVGNDATDGHVVADAVQLVPAQAGP